MIEIEDWCGNLVTSENLLEAIEKAHVFRVQKKPGGLFKIKELCDGYYCAYLTRDQLHQLADELKALADT